MKFLCQSIAFVLVFFAAQMNAQAVKSQRIIIIMMDGFGEAYYRNSDMPNLNKMEKDGLFKIVPSLMPAVTNVNNISIATGDRPEKNGITGNVFLNPATGKEEYTEDPALVLTPTIFQRAKKHGIRSALFSSKKKTVDLMGIGADISSCLECPGAAESEWAKKIGPPPGVYSKEGSYWVMDAALYAIDKDPGLGLIYIHTTDYMMHTWPPEANESKDFLHTIDEYIGKLHQAAPDAAILITADHGLNHKDLCWDLEKAMEARNTPIKMAISPEKDHYLKHHRGMGGASYVYLKNPKDAEKIKASLLTLQGVEGVLTREEAAEKYGLMPERIGDLMVLGNKTTVFGTLEKEQSEKLADNYRSHGSSYEAEVPLFVYNAKNAPGKSYFTANYLLASWLFR